MADDDPRDERLGRLLEVEPLDELAPPSARHHRDARVRTAGAAPACRSDTEPARRCRRGGRDRRGRRSQLPRPTRGTAPLRRARSPRGRRPVHPLTVQQRSRQPRGACREGVTSIRSGNLGVGRRPTAPRRTARGVPRVTRRRRRSPGRREPRPPPGLDHRHDLEHRHSGRAGERRRVARHAPCERWRARASCPTARSSRSAPAASAPATRSWWRPRFRTAARRSTPSSPTRVRFARSTEQCPSGPAREQASANRVSRLERESGGAGYPGS